MSRRQLLLQRDLSNKKNVFSLLKQNLNKLAKARKMRKPPGTLCLKKFGPGKFWVKKVWAQNIEKVEEKLKELKKKKS